MSHYTEDDGCLFNYPNGDRCRGIGLADGYCRDHQGHQVERPRPTYKAEEFQAPESALDQERQAVTRRCPLPNCPHRWWPNWMVRAKHMAAHHGWRLAR